MERKLEEAVYLEEIDVELPAGEYTLDWKDRYEITHEEGWKIYTEASVNPSELRDGDIQSEYEEINDLTAEDFQELWQTVKSAEDVSEGTVWQNRRIG